MQMGTLWLVGMMGSGKSTLGPALAERLGRDFADSDLEIEAAQHRSISEIFDTDGEARFRDLERETLDRLAGRDLVVSLGGGAIAQPGAADWLAREGTVVYLSATPETLLARLGDCLSRPLLHKLDPDARVERLRSILAERRDAYESAAVRVDTDDLAVDAIVDRVCRELDALADSPLEREG